MKLEYFPAHGRALMIRLALHLCNVEFEDKHYSQEEFGSLKAQGHFPGG